MKPRILPWLASTLLAGCAVGPDYVPPSVPAPERWMETEQSVSTESLRLSEWWKTFNDPGLNRLIDEAIRSNLDLKLAESRIREARAQRGASLAAALPSVSARGNYSRRRNNASLSSQSSGTSSSGGGIGVGNQIIDIFQLGFDASWELDLFGGVRRALESAEANLEAEQEGRRDVLVSLLGEVARNYIDLRANQQMLAVTRENLHSQEETLNLNRLRRQAGLASELEVAQSEGQVAVTRSQEPVYTIAVRKAIHALGVLLGQQPGKLAHGLEQEGSVPVSAEPGLADLPSELLRRRPDIRKAERKLAAANADIGVAVAELYPKVNLTAFLGLQNTRITDFTPLGKSWSMASSVSMPIFNWGRLQANLKAKEALHEQAFISYQSTLLNAFKDVEDALVGHAEEEKRRAALEQAVESQKLALTLADERYRKGLTAFLDVLEAERGLYQAQRDLVDGQARRSSQLVALYKALGGGWKAQDKEETPDGTLPDRLYRLLETSDASR
ncbi:MAG: efflux transporter outer membrane subunit [Methylococcaceae bacterium]|nr:efflux transporter outer membrane subunit [Methylococcaceae bacterium]